MAQQMTLEHRHAAVDALFNLAFRSGDNRQHSLQLKVGAPIRSIPSAVPVPYNLR
jgi:hypothetical protein